MTAHARQRQEIRLDPGAARRIGCGERENERRKGGLGVAGHGSAQAFAKAARHRGGVATLRILPHARRVRGPHRPDGFGRRRTRFAPMKKYMCLICGWIYDEAVGSPEDGIPPGTRWEDVPPNWTCPECGARKDDFEMVEF
jgi:rubredoxin